VSVESLNWNVVVAGYWNPAILTPAGIAQRLFGLEEGTPVQIEVPMDGLAPYRVRHDDLTVTAEAGRLIVSADAPRYDLLDYARKIAAKTIAELPETPLTAAGYNIRMHVDDPSNELLTATACEIDNQLSDAAFSIESRGLQRSLKIAKGVLNLSIRQQDDVTFEFNFHRQSSNRNQLIAWLEYPIDEVKQVVTKILEKVIGIPMGAMSE